MIDETAVKWLPATILELFQDKQESRLMEETDHGFSEKKPFRLLCGSASIQRFL